MTLEEKYNSCQSCEHNQVIGKNMTLEEKYNFLIQATFLDFRKYSAFVKKKMKCSPIGDGNTKTRTVSTYRTVGKHCPSDCDFLGNGCYAALGNVGTHQKRAESNENEEILNSFLMGLVYCIANELPMRLHVSGDFFENDKLDTAYVNGLIEILEFLESKRLTITPIWTYTHRMEAGLEPLKKWVTIRQSGYDGPLGAIVTESFKTFKRKKGQFLCPNSIDKKISCLNCKLCWKSEGTVVFEQIKLGRKPNKT